MLYRILRSPPGYPPEQQYLVAAYETLAFESCKFWVTKEDGSRFVATVEEARQLLPAGARLLPSEPHQSRTINLWNSGKRENIVAST
jgi:hypothetical protein